MAKTKAKTTKPQTTLVTVAVTTAGPVSMKAVRETVAKELYELAAMGEIEEHEVIRITVRRDANIERP